MTDDKELILMSPCVSTLVETGPFLSRDALQLGVGRGHDAKYAPFLLQFLPLVHRVLLVLILPVLLGICLQQGDFDRLFRSQYI